MDRIYKVVITGFVIQKEYMDEPDTWDWTQSSTYQMLFLDEPEVICTELVEATEVKRVIQEALND